MNRYESAGFRGATRQRHVVIRTMEAGQLASQPGCFVKSAKQKILVKYGASGKDRGPKEKELFLDRTGAAEASHLKLK